MTGRTVESRSSGSSSSATSTSSTTSRRSGWSGSTATRTRRRCPRRDCSSSAYRPQEMLSAHVSDSMVRAVNALEPHAGPRPAGVLRHRDRRQLRQQPVQRDSGGTSTCWTARPIRPDSGNFTKYEGVMKREGPQLLAPARRDRRLIPRVGTTASRRSPACWTSRASPSTAAGLDVDWYSVLRQPRRPGAGQLPDHSAAQRHRHRGAEDHLAAAGLQPGERRRAPQDAEPRGGPEPILAIPGAAAVVTPTPSAAS